MKAQELRIGNLLNHFWIDKDGTPHNVIRITGIMKQFIILDDNRLPEYLNLHENECEPIPLTEEWLVKFGFEKSKQPNGTIFYGQRSVFFRITKHPNRDDIFHLFGYEFTVVLEYVHQLQNLYFALTGEELTIK